MPEEPPERIIQKTPENLEVKLGDGSGGFILALGSPFTVGTEPFSITVGDVNADGKPDILTANRGSNNVTLLLGR
jgi:FG-GAP-like repeat